MKNQFKLFAVAVLVYFTAVHSNLLAVPDYYEHFYDNRKIVNLIEYKNDTLLAFSSNGVFIIPPIDGPQPQSYLYKELSQVEILEAIQQNDSIIWFIDKERTLYKFQNLCIVDKIIGNTNNFNFDLEDFDVNAKGDIFFSTYEYVYKLQGRGWKIIYDCLGIFMDAIKLEDDGSIYISISESGTIEHLDKNGKIDWITYDTYFYFGTPNDMAVTDTGLIIAASSGLLNPHKDKFNWLFLSEGVTQIEVDSKGYLWILTNKGNLFKADMKDLDYSSNTNFETSEIDETAFVKQKLPDSKSKIHHFILDKYDKIWAAAKDEVYCFDSIWKPVKALDLLNFTLYSTQCIDSNRWISTHKGLSVKQDDEWWLFNTPEISKPDIKFYASGNTVWTSDNNKLIKYVHNSSEHTLIKTKEILEPNVNNILTMGDTVIVGTKSSGVKMFLNEKLIKFFNTSNGLLSDSVVDMEKNKDRIVVATQSGISILSKGDIINVPTHNLGNISDIALGKNDTVWVSTSTGIYVQNNKGYHRVDAFDNITNASIEDDANGNLWLANSTNMYLYDTTGNSVLKLMDKWENINVNTIDINTGNTIWVTTNQGAYITNYQALQLPKNYILEPFYCGDPYHYKVITDGYVTSIDIRAANSATHTDDTYDFIEGFLVYSRVNGVKPQVQFRPKNNIYVGEWSNVITIEPVKCKTQVDLGICMGDSVYLQGAFRKTSGTFVDTSYTKSGCALLAITELTVHPTSSKTIKSKINEGDSIYLAGAYRNKTGVYLDKLVSNHGCDSITLHALCVQSKLKSSATLAGNKNDISDFLNAYPNPASDFIYLEMNSDAEYSKLELISASGETVHIIDGISNTAIIDVRGIVPSLYFLRIQTTDGKIMIKKVVVTHK